MLLSALQIDFTRNLLMARLRGGHQVSDIAARLGLDELDIHRRFTCPTELDEVSDLAVAMNCDLEFKILPREAAE